MSDIIDARGLAKAFGGNTVLDGVDLSASAGEAIAVVGANGAGKTTLMKILVGLLEADAGSVKLMGDDLVELTRRQIARRVAVVPQGSPQVFGFELLEFVLMGCYARSESFLPTGAQVEQAQAALEELGLARLAARPVSALSGGEMQRALMARAIVADVPLWFLDEPTASLDMSHQIALLEKVRRHVDKGGTVLAILHDLALVHRFFDVVVVLFDGQILAHGPPDEVLEPALVSNLYGLPMQRGEVDGKIVWIAK